MPRGFAESPGKFGGGNLLVYERQGSPDDPLGLWFYRYSKASDVDLYGTQFTVEIFCSFEVDDRERLFFLLNVEELEEMRTIQNRMVARLPPMPVDIPSYFRLHHDLRQRDRQMVDEPFYPRHDVWMRYRDEEDLLAWTPFVARLLPQMFERVRQRMNTPIAERKPFACERCSHSLVSGSKGMDMSADFDVQ